MKTVSHHRTTGYIYLGLKNRLALLRLALAVGSMATITTNYTQSVEMRPIPYDREEESPAEEGDDALGNPTGFVFGLYEGLALLLRLACWACLVIEVLCLNPVGIAIALASLWAAYSLWGKVITVEFGAREFENSETNQ
jgi:hypothetical protein